MISHIKYFLGVTGCNFQILLLILATADAECGIHLGDFTVCQSNLLPVSIQQWDPSAI